MFTKVLASFNNLTLNCIILWYFRHIDDAFIIN